MEGNLQAMLGAFIGVSILLGVGTIILGNSTMNCTGLSGYSSSASGNTSNSTGWARACLTSNSQAQSAYTLLLITLIVIAAVVVLSVVRML